MSFPTVENSGADGKFSSFNGTCEDNYLDEPLEGSVPDSGDKFHEVFQLKHGLGADLSGTDIIELVKSSGLDILDESVSGKNGDVSNHIAFILMKVLQTIEQRMFIQVKNFRNQNNLHIAREEKLNLRIEVLETLAMVASEENEILMKNLDQIKTRIEEKRTMEKLKILKMGNEIEDAYAEVSSLKQEFEMTKATCERGCMQLEAESKETKLQLEKTLKEVESELDISKKKVTELEEFFESKHQRWKEKEIKYQRFIDIQCGALKDLKAAHIFLKNEVHKTRRKHVEELNYLGGKLKELTDAAQKYHAVLAENRRLYNEVQDLKGNIRIYCRIRPSLGQCMKQTTIEYVGENGELVVTNPTKNGKDNYRLFKFSKVFGPAATQEEVFLDAQPLSHSVLDGYNVCIFAFGQTGSGKTYTMSGPDVKSKEEWGVNYRALNYLFQIAQGRSSSILYEFAVQMVEIYNEQVRDLLSTDGYQKRLGIWSTAQPNGLAVPEASMRTVKTMEDILELMKVGLTNQAVGATALNERSSRSHSVLTVHVRGTDVQTNAMLCGDLHLIDLAGIERVDRSEATGDRLREAQQINKSLSALGDLIFALAQKSSHVPYRNSKLTQFLRSSLGGQAESLMYVQLNPDVDSYSETVSTLKFAERVSGVELGAAQRNKEGREVRELVEQVASLKDTIAKKNKEIERLLSLKPTISGYGRVTTSLSYGFSSSRKHSIGTRQQTQRIASSKISGLSDKTASDGDNCSDFSDRHSESGLQQSVDKFLHQKDLFCLPLKLSSRDIGPSADDDDVDLLGWGGDDYAERLTDISDCGFTMSTKTDGSVSSAVECTVVPETTKPPMKSEKSGKVIPPSELPKSPQPKLLP